MQDGLGPSQRHRRHLRPLRTSQLRTVQGEHPKRLHRLPATLFQDQPGHLQEGEEHTGMLGPGRLTCPACLAWPP